MHELKMYFARCPKPLGNRGDIHKRSQKAQYAIQEKRGIYSNISYVRRDVSNKVWYSFTTLQIPLFLEASLV